MKIEISKDKITGFPCLRELRQGTGGEFVSLFPVTKYQVEQCIYEGHFNSLSPENLNEMIKRFVFKEIRETPDEIRRPVYPQKILKIGRDSIFNTSKNNICNIVATNLTLWNDNRQLCEFAPGFPTTNSEWGTVLTWLGGRIPSEVEWDNILSVFSKTKTIDLLNSVLESGIIWTETVMYLLEKFSETLAVEDFGLPFQNKDFYELTKSDLNKLPLVKHGGKHSRDLHYKLPNVVGDSNKSLWPTIGNTGINRNHSVLNEFVPVVALRIWYNEKTVDRGNHKFHQKDIEIHDMIEPDKRNQIRKVRAKKVESKRNTMRSICPICYQEIDSAVFENERPLWHIEKFEEKEDIKSTVVIHSNEKPSTGYISCVAIHADFLDIARTDSSKINSVTLSGYTRQGKTCYMLSTLGMHLYPKGKSYLERFFPKEMNFSNQRCDMYGLTSDELLTEIEDAFILGILPNRTVDLKDAFRAPIKYTTGRKSGSIFGSRNNSERILVINDIAGETIANPNNLESIKRLHVKMTTDIIFMHPANDIQNADDILTAFVSGFGAINYNGRMLSFETNKINFIFVLNMIDELDPLKVKEKELLDILLTEPYQLPQKNDEDECIDYFNSMKIVNNRLEEWVDINYPGLGKILRQFQAVRFCGISALGFMPVLENRRSIDTQHENYVPFEIQPIRIMDPIFWILYDNNFFKF